MRIRFWKGISAKCLLVAGFSIITLTFCVTQALAQITIKPVPSVALDYPFYEIRDIATQDSLIVVVTGQEADFIKVFSNNRHLKSFGKTGPGPYEFKNPQKVCTLPDRVVILDFKPGNSKLVSFSWQGSPIKEIPIRNVQMVNDLVCSGNRKIIQAGTFMSPKKGIVLAEAEKEIFSYFLPESITISPSDGVMNNFSLIPPFAPRFHWDLADSNKLVFWDGTGNKLHKITFAKDTISSITLGDHQIEIETDDIKSWLLQEYPPGTVAFGRQNFYRGVREEILATVTFPEFFPLVLDIEQDPNGGVWILKALKEDEQIWFYYKPDGNFITVSFPSDREIMDFGEKWIVAKGMKGDGFETVELYKRSDVVSAK